MAIWQFDLSFVPCGEPLPVRGPDGYDARPFSAEAALKAGKWLSERVGISEAMTDDWFVYGDMDGNRIDLLFNEDGTGEIGARVDARVEATEFLSQISDLCSVIGGEPLAVESWKLLEAKPAVMALALE